MAWLTLEEFATIQGLTLADVRRYVCDGMPAEPGPHGPRIIDEDEAREWLEEQGLEDESEDECEDDTDTSSDESEDDDED